MNLEDYQPFDGPVLKEKIRSLSREELDDQFQWLGGQYSVLCQRLEALYSPDRLERFVAIRPGEVSEIDKAIDQTAPENSKELNLLKNFRELNRILVPFMDVYEENVVSDLQHMSKEELETVATNIAKQLSLAEESLKANAGDYRKVQDATGTIRLATLMNTAVRRELRERFGEDLD